ncbi:flagellar hook-associated protein FlgL [Pseudogulbenkiania subflava]|uniref:Flagellar hook-associated protein 3 FlgL n=1 Tax=Pseudogulbenkiania subflava DSM 22618 TaxID=1123014 RepID=A0A1Y6BNC0_9NEIS|nr:flagellar hook-associated protein FlgL [Pseudogulbenkiania subflava]SMF16672.1 flagellar hook-associated protein 3 FlgL [Pseudogulbenkiania subflava DSM 22618]
MRISTSMVFNQGYVGIQGNQYNLTKLQEQLSAQKRVVVPSDDPVASAQMLEVSQSDGRTNQFVKNGDTVESTLAISETSLSSANDLLSNLKTLAIQAGNASLDNSQLTMIQSEVKERFQQLLSYANATDGRGNYLYGGNAIDNPPFVADSSLNVTYNGDTGRRDVQISDARQVPITEVGSAVYGDAISNTAVFDNVRDLYNLLGQNPRPATYTTQLNTIMSGLDSAQVRLSTTEASIGSRRSENETLQSVGQDLDVQYQTRLSNLDGLDLAKTISDFTLAQTALQYSQLTFQKVSGLSLFNYLS